MAIASLTQSPNINSRADSDYEFNPRRDFRLVADSTVAPRADRKSFVFFLSAVAVVGLLLLLAINTMLAQDAFELARLQSQATTLNDHREAVMKKIALESSPGVLALRAKQQGMIPSQSPRFLALDSGVNSTSTTTQANANNNG